MSNMKSSGSPRLPSTQKSGNPKQSNAVTGSKYATYTGQPIVKFVFKKHWKCVDVLEQQATILVVDLQEWLGG